MNVAERVPSEGRERPAAALREGFWQRASRHPDRVAVVEPGGSEVTYGELLDESRTVVHLFRSLGLVPDDTVAVALPNRRELFAVYLAALEAGWYFTTVNWHLTGPEIAHILDDSEASAFVADGRCAGAASDAARAAGLVGERCFGAGDVAGFRDVAAALRDQPSSEPESRTPGQRMLYTSGTTGRPKGVRRARPAGTPEDGVAGMVSLLATLFDLVPDDGVHLAAGPLYHAGPLGHAVAALHLGHTVVMMDRWSAEETLRLIERHRVTSTHLVPTQLHRLVDLPAAVRDRYDVSSLRHVIHAAAPCPAPLKHRVMEWWGPVVYEYYGATEGGGTSVRPHEWLVRPGTVGRPWPGAEIAILDEAGEPCPPGVVGTVYIRTPMGDFEYHRDPEKTAEATRGELFTVGDLGYLDDEGWLFLADRKADTIISGGVNVYPAEVEGVLSGHGAVDDVAVVGVPDEEWGERVVAVVQPAAGATPDDVLAGELVAFCREHLARFKCPREVRFGEVPRLTSGKLARRRLREDLRGP